MIMMSDPIGVGVVCELGGGFFFSLLKFEARAE